MRHSVVSFFRHRRQRWCRSQVFVRLDSDEREHLPSLIDNGGRAGAALKQVQIPLKADQGRTDTRIAEFAEVSLSTVSRVRQRCIEEVLDVGAASVQGCTVLLSRRQRRGFVETSCALRPGSGTGPERPRS